MEDRYLIVKCKRGCRESLTRIYAKYRKDLLILALSLLNDPTAAEDIVHDVFVHFAESVSTFRLTGSLKGYLLTCTANRARNHNKAKRSDLSLSRDTTGESQANPAERLVCNEQLQNLAQALDQLPYEQREIMMLHMYGGLSLRRLAKQMGLSANTAMSRYRYGVKKLKTLLNGDGDR